MAAGDTARSSLGGALTVAQHIGGPTGNHIADAAREAFIHYASCSPLAGQRSCSHGHA
jgi:hypothetical protein